MGGSVGAGVGFDVGAREGTGVGGRVIDAEQELARGWDHVPRGQSAQLASISASVASIAAATAAPSLAPMPS